MMMSSFKAHRKTAEIVAPARATPRETKALSDMDDFALLRVLQPLIVFFGVSPGGVRRPDDPAKVIKKALAEALVYYYPLAGRLREAPGDKLVVECTGEGVVFVEAEADVYMEELGNPPPQTSPSAQEWMCPVADIKDVVGTPLFYMQVTQLRCGGFVLGFRICHNLADGYGAVEFANAIAHLARGEETPKMVLPIWERELLTARVPPRIDPVFESFLQIPSGDDVMLSTPPEEMVGQYFYFGARDVAALRNHAPAAQSASTFDLLTAVMWRCRTKALGYAPHHRAALLVSVNGRGRLKGGKPLIPHGYYGNAVFYAVVDAAVGELCGSPLGHTIEIVRQAKKNMTEENMESTVDFIASLRGKPPLWINRLYQVSDIKWIGEDAMDYGWAKKISLGVPILGEDASAESWSYHMSCTNDKGEKIIAVSMLLPKPAMEKFANEIAAWTNTKKRASL